jgi:L-ascorbate metabolism protein UlaG (beta-lactamase superfamily)
MSRDVRYALAQNVCVEPLIARWPAWAHVVAPAIQCLHLVNYQIKTLQSFLANPQLHETSCKNPKLLGGAFVDIPAARVAEVKALLDMMQARLAQNISFGHALTEFQNWLAENAKGESLAQCYARTPEPLRGYVELLYDYYNHPIVRCFESMLYHSKFYDKDLQSLRLFPLESDLSRSYYMSTPRLPDAQAIDWRLPFEDARVDALFALDEEPRSFAEIQTLLGVTTDKETALRAMLRESESVRRAPWTGAEPRVRYFGHACALVEQGGVSILVDPLISTRPEPDRGIERFSFDDLPPRIDYALITHGHHDHFVIETLLRLRRRIATLVVPKNSGVFHGDMSLKLMAERLGFRYVREVESFEEISLPNGRIVAAPFLGEHNDLPSAKTAYVVEIAGKRVMFAADSNCLDAKMYDHLLARTGPVDTLFVGMECVGAPLTWVYGPILPKRPGHRHSQDRRSNGCDADAALALSRAVRCRRAFVYAVGREPWVRYLLALTPAEDDVYMGEIGKFIETLRGALGVPAELLFGRAEILI